MSSGERHRLGWRVGASFLSNPRPISGTARKDSVTSLSIKLEARSAVHRCFRAYQIDVDTDLFGVWLVEMSYGRIGGLGRSKIRSFTTIEGAQAQVHACLRKRATAPRRIGVAYRVRGRTRCEQWCQPDLVDHLDAWFPVPGAVLPEPVAGSNRGHATTYAELGSYRLRPLFPRGQCYLGVLIPLAGVPGPRGCDETENWSLIASIPLSTAKQNMCPCTPD